MQQQRGAGERMADETGFSLPVPDGDPPPAIGREAWGVAEIRTGGAPGRRLFVLGALEVPEGFRLCGYSGPLAAGAPTAATAQPLTPGTATATPGGMQVGEVCYSRLYWQRLADGAFLPAHPADEQAAFAILGTVTAPAAAIPEDIEPFVTVDAPDAVRAVAEGFLDDWMGTLPPGRNPNARRYIGLSGTRPGPIDLRRLDFGALPGIAVRHVGRYSDYGCSSRMRGRIRLEQARNVWLDRMHIVGPSRVATDGSRECGIRRCLLETVSGLTDPFTEFESWGQRVLEVTGASDFFVEESYLRYARNCLILTSQSTNVRYEDLVVDWTSHDQWKNFAGCSGVSMIDCWGARRQANQDGGPHEDLWQAQGGMRGFYFRGNVYLMGQPAWWRGNAGANQGYWISTAEKDPVPLEESGWEQNIIANNNGAIKVGNARQRGCWAYENTCIQVGWGDNGPHIDIADSQRNLIFGELRDPGAGKDGLHIQAGPGPGRRRQMVDGERVRRSNPREATRRDLRPLLAYYRPLVGYPFSYDRRGLEPKDPPGQLSDLFVREGSRAWWGYSGPQPRVGAWKRHREIEDPLYRAQQGKQLPWRWPTRAGWLDTHNLDGQVIIPKMGEAFQGYDGNGDLL